MASVGGLRVLDLGLRIEGLGGFSIWGFGFSLWG